MAAHEDDRAPDSEAFIRTGLDLLGVAADDAEIAVMLAADSLYRPVIQTLLEAELDDIVPEQGIDLSGPPAR